MFLTSPADPASLATEIRHRARGRHLVVLCDFDGTLCEFHPDPEAVWLPDTLRARLNAIAARPDATVGIVTGRRVDDLRQRVRLAGDVYYAGFHGLEIEGPESSFVHPAIGATRELVRELGASLSSQIAGLPGVFIENKHVSVVAHFREAPADVQARVSDLFDRVTRPHVDGGRLRVMRGSCAREIMPRIDWHKGSAVEWICDRVERRHGSAWPVYIGDDITDEDAFRVVRPRGLAIAASDRVTGAEFRLDGPAAVEALLSGIR